MVNDIYLILIRIKLLYIIYIMRHLRVLQSKPALNTVSPRDRELILHPPGTQAFRRLFAQGVLFLLVLLRVSAFSDLQTMIMLFVTIDTLLVLKIFFPYLLQETL